VKKVLFVCLGNICRSPAAQAIMENLIAKNGLEKFLACASAGLSSHHIGERPDSRMRQHGEARGYSFNSLAKKFSPEFDFANFDFILAMDHSNLNGLKNLTNNDEHLQKLHLICNFSRSRPETEVPDPYYGGDAGFALVLDILEDSCYGFMEHVRSTSPAGT
jgi:protein-tyrosine phosphatase